MDEEHALESSLILGGYQVHNVHLKNGTTGTASSIVKSPATNRHGLQVMNCCAICLSSYKEHDVVVWSENESNCKHAFHQDCLLDWLCKVQQSHLDNVHTPCPICRQNFLPNLSKYFKGKIIKAHITAQQQHIRPINNFNSTIL